MLWQIWFLSVTERGRPFTHQVQTYVSQEMEDQLRKDFEEEKACLQAAFNKELEAHRCRLNEEKAQEIAAFKANYRGGVEDPPAFPPPPPPPPPRETSFVLLDDLANLPGRRVPLPTKLTFRGQTTRDKESIKVIFGYARLLRKVPGAVFTDPLEDLSEVLLRLRGDSRHSSPASTVARSGSGMREPPRSRAHGSASQSRGRSTLCSTPVTDAALTDRVRRLERRVDETADGLREDVWQLKNTIQQMKEAVQRLEERKHYVRVRRSALQQRTAPPRLPGISGASSGTGEDIWTVLGRVFARGQDVVPWSGENSCPGKQYRKLIIEGAPILVPENSSENQS